MAEQNGNPKQTGLILIGMGPGGIGSMTADAVAAATAADLRYYEAYTALWPATELAELEKVIGRIEKVMRPKIEHPDEILNLAAEQLVAILIVGDPLQATTHIDLQLQAEERNITCEILHGISITNLVTGAVGLSNYKFGRQTTLTYAYSGWIATSPLEVIAINRLLGHHTLALLDLDPTGSGEGQQKPMSPRDAAEVIHLMLNKVKEEVGHTEENGQLVELKQHALAEITSLDTELLPVVLCSDMGTKDQMIINTTLGELASLPGGRMNCLVFPAITSDVEEKALLRWVKEE